MTKAYRRGARHYEVSFLRPPAGSLYEFLVQGVRLLEAEEQLPIWYYPVDITPALSANDAAYYRRQNEVLEAVTAILEAEALSQLRAAGVPKELLKLPLTDTGRSLVRPRVAAMRLGMKARLEMMPPPMAAARDICTRVITAAYYSIGGRSSTKTAELLNGECSRDARGLTRDHIDRAIKAEAARWQSRQLGQDEIYCLFADVELLEALVSVHQKARQRDDFKGLRGADLVQAIDHRHGLAERVHRADRILCRHHVERESPTVSSPSFARRRRRLSSETVSKQEAIK